MLRLEPRVMIDVLPFIADSLFWQQTIRFWSLQDGSVRTALAGVLMLSVSCGTLGSFVVLRRLSLLGDSLGHAVLPGVCLGFLVTQTKDPLWIFLGASTSALLGSWLIGFIHRHSRLKTDTAMGLVLSGFFGMGTLLLTRMQNFPYGNQSGLNQFLFGQASAVREEDLVLIGILSTFILGSIVLLFKELTLTSFDEGFAASIGLPVRAIHYLLMALLALAIVISIQAVGVVLLSALLITPAATAYLLTDRLKSMVLLSVAFGVIGGITGLNLSFLERSLPTGPFIVLTLSIFFSAAYLFAPHYGVVMRRLRRFQQAQRTRRENVLKSILLAKRPEVMSQNISPDGAGWRSEEAEPVELSLVDLARYRGETLAATRRALRPLVRRHLVTVAGDRVALTRGGHRRAYELARNYRLWELFLIREVQLPLDHTERDAEQLEHILGEGLVQELEAKFNSAPGANDSPDSPSRGSSSSAGPLLEGRSGARLSSDSPSAEGGEAP
jgi:manganese/zinc/iron transport system permease protein